MLVGGLYALFSLGLSLPWGLLRILNFAHFAYVYLAAYVTYDLSTKHGVDPLITLLITIPLGVMLGTLTQWFTSKASLDTFGSLIATFGVFIIVQAAITLHWKNDLVRIPSDANPYFVRAWQAGQFTVPFLGALALLVAAIICIGSYYLLEHSYGGRGIRATVQEPEMAAAFGVDKRRLSYLVAGVAGGSGAIAGTFLAMLFAITPSGAQSLVSVVFATSLLGGLGNPRGVLGAAIIVGITESLTQRFADPALAKLTPIVLLVIVILIRPQGLFRSAVGVARP